MALHGILYNFNPAQYEERMDKRGGGAWLRGHAYVTWVLAEIASAMTIMVSLTYPCDGRYRLCFITTRMNVNLRLKQYA